MKNSLLTIVMLVSISISQLFSQTLAISDLVILDKTGTVKIDYDENNNEYKCEVIIVDTSTVNLRKLNIEIFRSSLFKAVKDAYGFDNNQLDLYANKQAILGEIDRIFLEAYAAKSANPEVQPIAGWLSIEENFTLKRKNKFITDKKINVKSVSIEIYNGNIKNAIVVGSLSDGKIDKEIILYNASYIPFSTQSDYNTFCNYRLYVQNEEVLKDTNTVNSFEKKKTRVAMKQLRVAKRSAKGLGKDSLKYEIQELKDSIKSRQNFYIDFCDIFTYIRKLHENSEDYSPENKVYEFNRKSGFTKQILFKEKSTEILNARFFSDLRGLDNQNPNGIIQIEAERDIIINNKRWIGRYWRYVNMDWLSIITPFFSINKIEDNNRYLTLDPNIQTSDTAKVTPIDLISHSNFSVGFKGNIFSLHFPELKTSASTRFNFYMFSTPVVDTINNQAVTENLYSTRMGFDFPIVFKPHPNFGFQILFGWSYVELQSGSYIQVGGREQYVNGKHPKREQRGVFNYGLEGWLALNDKGSKMFLRTNYNLGMAGDRDENFFQVQVGYSFDIIKNQVK